MNVFTFISIVRPCLHEETLPAKLVRKKEENKNHFVYRIKTVYMCEPLWWPVDSKTCVIVCHFGDYSIIIWSRALGHIRKRVLSGNAQ